MNLIESDADVKHTSIPALSDEKFENMMHTKP